MATVFAALIAGYSALGFFGVPYYFNTIVPEDFHAKTSMVLLPTAVRFNPFTLQFTTGETRVIAPSGGTILTLDSLRAQIAPLAALRGEIVGRSLLINELAVTLSREQDGTYNFQSLLDAAKNDIISLNNISVTNSKIVFNDRLTGKMHTVEKIHLELPTFANTSRRAEQYLRPHFSAIVNGSPIELTGQASLNQAGKAEAMRLAVDIHDLVLPLYTGYLPFSLPMQCTKGIANGKIDLLFNPQNSKEQTLSISFFLQTTGVELVNEARQITMEVPSAQMEGRLQPISRTLQLNEIAIKEPIVSSIAGAWRENQAAPAEETQKRPAPYHLLVERLLVENGLVRFFSTKDAPQPSSVWKTVQLSVKNYRSDTQAIAEQPAGSFSLTGEKEGTSASFSWQGKFSAQDSLSGNLHLTKMDGKDLLQVSGVNHPFTTGNIQGDADLRGQLILYTPKELSGRINYKLVDTELTLEDFILYDNEQSILDAPQVKLSGLSLVDKTIDFGTVQLRSATARFISGRLPKIYRQFSLPQYRPQGLDFEGKVLLSAAESSATPLIFSEVLIKANELGSTSGIGDNFSFTAKSPAGAVFKAQGMVSLSPFAATLKTAFWQLPIENIWPIFSSSAVPAEMRGILRGKGSLSLPGPGFDGELELSELTGHGPQKTPFSWQKSVFNGVQYTAQPFHLDLASVSVDGGHFSWQITSEMSSPLHHFSAFMQTYFPVGGQGVGPEKNGFIAPVSIEEITFTAGSIDVYDRRLSPAWTAENISFAGSIKNIKSTPAAESQFSFTGRLADSPFTVTGTVAPFSKEENGTVHFLLDTLPLTLFTKQFGQRTVIDTTSAHVNLLLDGSWQGQQYVNSGKLNLNGLKPPTASSELALPLALLSDANGTIEVPFTFSRTAPMGQTSLAEELSSSIEHLLLKGRISPLLLASGDFTDLIGTESIDFHPGEAVTTDSGRQTLNRYAELLIAHPQAGLILSGGIDKEIDGQAMQQSLSDLEQQRVELENEKLLQQWQEQKVRYQQNLANQPDNGADTKIVEQDIPPAILSDFKPLTPQPVQIDDEMLLELAHKRIELAYQYLTIENDVAPEQVTTVFPDSAAGQAQGSGSSVALTLTARTAKE